MYITGWISYRIGGPGQFLILSGAIPGSCWAVSCAPRAAGRGGVCLLYWTILCGNSENELSMSLTRRVCLGGGPAGAAVEQCLCRNYADCAGMSAARVSLGRSSLHACRLLRGPRRTSAVGRAVQDMRWVRDKFIEGGLVWLFERRGIS